MTSLGEKLNAHKKMKSIIEDLTPKDISDSTAKRLNELFSVFNSNYVLTKKDDNYDIKEIEEFYEKCLARIKREYSAKFMNSLAITMMFQEEE